MNSQYIQRETGKYPISIATSLAMEGLFGIHDNIPPQSTPPVTNCDAVAVNARTLIRNILGSHDKTNSQFLTVEYVVKLLLDEILTIKSILEIESQGRVQAFMYIPSYRFLKMRYRNAIIKEPTTEKQIKANKFEEDCIELLLKRQGDIHVSFSVTDLDIAFNHDPRVFLITHLPVDLLHCKGVKSVALLESHTGIVKYSNQWYTKLKNGKDLYRIPFDVMSIQFFGDSGGMFTPYETKMRKVLLEIADKNQWTQLTSKNKIVGDVMKAYEPILASIISGLY